MSLKNKLFARLKESLKINRPKKIILALDELEICILDQIDKERLENIKKTYIKI